MMFSPSIVDKTFIDDSIKNESTNLYNLVINEVPEISNCWVYIFVYKNELLSSQIESSGIKNFYFYSSNSRTFYKKISIGTVYKHSYSLDSYDNNPNSVAYWVILDNLTERWNVFSDNYKIAQQNNFVHLWYGYSNFKLNVDSTISLGSGYYSQPLIRKASDEEYVNNEKIYNNLNDEEIYSKACYFDTDFIFNWKCKLTDPYIRAHLSGYKL